MKKQNGITLIGLVITIIVLLILAGVSLATLTGENGVLTRAQDAVEKNEEAADIENILLALGNYAIEVNTEEEAMNLAEVIKQETWCMDAVYDEEKEETIVTIEECGHAYKVEKDGTITPMKGVMLDKTIISLELKEGSTVTDTLTASLYDVEGAITWKNSDDNVATISGTSGKEITITAVGVGTTTITAICGEYESTCKVSVIEMGVYVKYNIPYTDMYTSYEFTETTGWRYLGTDESGNKLIVSTGVPAKLYYHSNSNEGKDVNGWWGTDEEVTELYGAKYSENGYDSDNGGYPNRYAAAGLLKHFENIPYTTTTSNPTTENTMTGTVRGNGKSGPLGPTIGTAFRASNVSSKIVDVHNLSLAELNKALNRLSTSTSNVGTDSTGLINLISLNNYGYTELSKYNYFVTESYSEDSSPLCCVGYTWLFGSSYDSLFGTYNATEGVRPVITLDSNVKLVDTDGDGIFEIK